MSARSCDEYEGMFGLDMKQMRLWRILDCGGGGASFTAEWSERGGLARACDPIYSEPVGLQDELVRCGVERAALNIVAEPGRYIWTRFETPEQHRAARQLAATRFLGDRTKHPARYVAARLPELPFEDQAFDLVLSSHLLFAYSRTLSLSEHVAYAVEMVRVAAREVRIYPLVGFERPADDAISVVTTALEERGVTCERRAAPYHFLRGATEYLSLRP